MIRRYCSHAKNIFFSSDFLLIAWLPTVAVMAPTARAVMEEDVTVVEGDVTNIPTHKYIKKLQNSANLLFTISP